MKVWITYGVHQPPPKKWFCWGLSNVRWIFRIGQACMSIKFTPNTPKE